MHLQCSCPEAGETTHQARTNPGQAQSYSHQQKGMAALKGWGTHQDSWRHWVKGKLTKSCLGSHQYGPRCLHLPLLPGQTVWPMGHPPNRVDPPAGSPHPCDFPCDSLR